MKAGVTRIVICFKGVVVKIPNFLCQHDHFLMGCLANWNERKLWKAYRECEGMPHRNLVAPSVYCAWFGLFQVQKRVRIRSSEDHLTADELMIFKKITTDTKAANFGYYKGNLVCVDYG